MNRNISTLFLLPIYGTFLLAPVKSASWDDSKGVPPLRRSYARYNLTAPLKPFSLNDYKAEGNALESLRDIARSVLDDNVLDSTLASLSVRLSLGDLDIPDNSPELLTLRSLLKRNPAMVDTLDIQALANKLLQQKDTQSRLDVIQQFFS